MNDSLIAKASFVLLERWFEPWSLSILMKWSQLWITEDIMNSWQFTWRLTREKTWPRLWPKPVGDSVEFVSGELSRSSTVKQCNVYSWSFMILGKKHNKNRKRKKFTTIHWPVAQTNASYLYLSLLLICRGDSVPTSKDAWAVFLPVFPGKSWSLL